MITFVLASGNQNKIKEFHEILDGMRSRIGEFRLLSLKDIDFNDEIEENGTTFEENAWIKASCIAKLGYIAIADDSGIAVDALGGAPGIYSARYSGVHGNDEDNNRLLLKNLENKQDRSAHYVCAVACVFPDGRGFTVRGECHGEILQVPRGKGGFGYDPLFYFPSLGKTFAELTSEEKNRVSHRRVASEKFAQEMMKYL